MIKTELINQCFSKCPFFKMSNGRLECYHPYFDDKQPHERKIITNDNCRDGRIPEDCPLRMNDLVIEYKLL